MLETEIFGVKFKNPLMLAGGIMGSTAASMNWILKSGAGAIVSKSFSKEANPGYVNPTTVEVEGGIINAIGLSSPGVDAFLGELEKVNNNPHNEQNTTKTNNSGKLIASIYGSDIDEFSYLCNKIASEVDMIELNVSCPHAMGGCGAAIGQDPNLTYEVVKASKKALKNKKNKFRKNIPIIAKLTPNVTDIVEIATSAEEAGADGLTLINSLGPGLKIDIVTGKPILSNKVGGMSGPAIKPIALRCVWDVYKDTNIPIIGVGGITNYKDVLEFLYAGASAVQIGTGIMYEGVEIFSNINNGLINFMKENKISSLSEIIGLSHKD
ncbi:MAG: dihydroorotate dehydrogenase [Methanobacteriaceae archaeon]